MTKKTKERVQLSQESINKILDLVSTKMSAEAKFAFDSRGMEVFVQNTDQVVFEDKHTKNHTECMIRKRDPRFSLEEVIAAEIISDVSAMALKVDYAAYKKYSYSFYDEPETEPLSEVSGAGFDPAIRDSKTSIRYSKSIG